LSIPHIESSAAKAGVAQAQRIMVTEKAESRVILEGSFKTRKRGKEKGLTGPLRRLPKRTHAKARQGIMLPRNAIAPIWDVGVEEEQKNRSRALKGSTSERMEKKNQFTAPNRIGTEGVLSNPTEQGDGGGPDGDFKREVSPMADWGGRRHSNKRLWKPRVSTDH